MPLVFVHGVSVRAGPSYERQQRFRDAAFRRHVLPRQDTPIHNPYWGDVGAKAAWNHASLPGDPLLVLEALGPQETVTVEQVLISEEAAGYTQPDSVLLDVARQDFQEAIDLLVSSAIEESGIDARALVAVASELSDYAERNPSPAWISQVGHDHAFLDRLREETRLESVERGHGAPRPDDQRTAPRQGEQHAANRAGEQAGPRATERRTGRTGGALIAPPPFDPGPTLQEQLDVWDALARAIERVREAVADWRWGQPGRSLRRLVQPYLTHFVGDIFVYLKERGTPARPGAIIERVSDAIAAAAREVRPGDPLIIVAHSMGANVVYDVLTSFLKGVRVDTLVTVGNQIGWFEEMKLFAASDPAVPGPHRSRVARPVGVGRWLNVIDTSDYLAYAAEPIFDGVEDVTFTTGRGPLAAHTEYFKDVGFFQRLGAWLWREAEVF